MCIDQEKGYVLITSLLLLAVVTILGVSAVSTVTLQERMASNMLEKQRSFEAASIALREGEVFLYQRVDYPGISTLPNQQSVDISSSGVSAGVASNPTYTIGEARNATLGGDLKPASQMGKRSQAQVYYYSVLAQGVGGNSSAVTILQSIYGRIY